MPSGITDDALEKEYPFYGTNVERNKVSKYFNEYLKQKLEKFNILFIDIFDKLVFENFKTNDSYYFDGIHLPQKAMPYFLNELLKKYRDFFRFKKKNMIKVLNEFELYHLLL